MKSEEYLTSENCKLKIDSWTKSIESCSRRRTNLIPEISKSALIIVDMLNLFTSKGGAAYIQSSPVIIQNILKLKTYFEDNNAPVIFTRHCHENPSDLGMIGKFYKNYIQCDSNDSQIIDILKPYESDLIVTKNTYDAFYNTELPGYLKKNGIAQLVITGVLTHLCCETTARSAFVRGYEVFIPMDALGSKNELLHLSSLISLTDGVSITMSTKDYIRNCK